MKLNKGDNFFYVFRDTYDAAVILSNRYNEEGLIEQVNVNRNKENDEAYKVLRELLPEPINSLAIFLCLVDESLNTDNEEQLCGVLSALTEYIDPVKFISTEALFRKHASYSLAIVNEYQMSWQKFFTMAIKADEIEELLKPAEIHSKVEQQLAMPVYMLNGGQMFTQQAYGQQPEQSGQDSIDVSTSDDGSQIFFDDDEDYVPPDISQFMDSEDDKDIKEEKEDTDRQETTTRQAPMLTESDQAGFNAKEDRAKAEKLLGINQDSKIASWEV